MSSDSGTYTYCVLCGDRIDKGEEAEHRGDRLGRPGGVRVCPVAARLRDLYDRLGSGLRLAVERPIIQLNDILKYQSPPSMDGERWNDEQLAKLADSWAAHYRANGGLREAHGCAIIAREIRALPIRASQAPRVCVAVLVTDPARRILLGRRAKPPNLGKWVFPGGGVETGETLREAARRELREETGLDVDIPEQRTHVVENTGTKGTTAGFRGAVIHFFRATASGEPIAGDDLLEPTWFAPDALPDNRSDICHEALALFEGDGAEPSVPVALTADDVILRVQSDPEFLGELHEKMNAVVAQAQAGTGGRTH